MTTRKEQAALTRKKIINAAEDLIREKGHDAIRISDITNACQMSAGNFYYYFKSVNELFEEIDDKKFYETFASLNQNYNENVTARINSYFADWIGLTLSYYGSRYMYHWTRHYTLISSSSCKQNRIMLMVKHLEKILNDGIQKGELVEDTPVLDIAHSIAFAIFGCSAYFGLTSDESFILKWRIFFSETYITNTLAAYTTKSTCS